MLVWTSVLFESSFKEFLLFFLSIQLNLAGPVCSASHQNWTKFWLALPIVAWGLVFVLSECDLGLVLRKSILIFLILQIKIYFLRISSSKIKGCRYTIQFPQFSDLLSHSTLLSDKVQGVADCSKNSFWVTLNIMLKSSNLQYFLFLPPFNLIFNLIKKYLHPILWSLGSLWVAHKSKIKLIANLFLKMNE